jgi:threonylcarbamoyladenosine tRNA methylthiotransferase MtaB
VASKVAFYTLGCKLNFTETSTIGDQFLKHGFDIVDYKEIADVYVINTCTVTENTERECRQIVRRALRNNPLAFIAVVGCYAQLRPEEIAKIEGVDAVFGTNEKFKIHTLLENFNKKDLSCIFVSPIAQNDDFDFASSTEADTRTRAFLKIQDGCDYKCSFCTIPLARGKSRSMNPDGVTDNFKKLLDNGYKEIILTGVNVGDYGKSSGKNLYNVLTSLISLEGDFRIRISSIEPNLLTDEIIDLTASSDKICRHFHIPLQSGSGKILNLMQRRYKTNNYKDLILKATEKISKLGVGVDVIVGFPGESGDDFMETYNFLKDLPISYLHVFTYSERPDTKAITMDGRVEIAERKRRNNMLRILSDKKKNEFYRNMIGTEHTVLFEEENHNGFLRGFASNYVRVKHSYNKNLVNQLTRIKIEEVDDNICTALSITNNLSTLAG